MFSRQTFESPWPAETPLPAASSSSSLSPSRRRRTVAERHAEPAAIAERATIANQSQIGAYLAPLHHSRRAFCFAVILTFVLHFLPASFQTKRKQSALMPISLSFRVGRQRILRCSRIRALNLFVSMLNSLSSERPAHLLYRMQGTVDILISLSLTLSISL